MPGNKKRIRRASTIYWLLLFYVVAALVWWFISLEKQNSQMRDFKREHLSTSVDKVREPAQFAAATDRIEADYQRNLVKFISEGSTFLILILIGASFVYRSVRRLFLLQQQQQNFMMAVTHELKTPISVARLNLETMQKHQLDPERQRKLLRMTLEETERLNSLTSNILISSQLEGDGYGLSMDELDLSDLFKDCLRNFTQRLPDRVFIDAVEPAIDVNGDPLLLQLLINNLLENAVKYSPKQGAITCVLKTENDRAVLQVLDEGSGVTPQERENIFKKFYRIGDETTRKTQGTGLGLYLCRKIAEDHHAVISVSGNEARGSNFTVVFRRNP
jgi:two-component system, OmpR family, sensor histidine kinase CiaH